MASGLEALVGAATEGMRKTQSAEEMAQTQGADMQPLRAPDGHLSDSAAAPTRERKKGVPWTEDEHRLFLLGLQKLGKGDWRGISRHFVQSRTPTQVASHAQKYFIRQNNMNKRKRRSSLFDIVNEAPEEDQQRMVHGVAGAQAPQAPQAPGNIGGLSMAFASHLGGYNPTGMAPPAKFSNHGARPPAAATSQTATTTATTSDIGTAGEAAAATIAALSMAGSPAATAGYAAAAKAAGADARASSYPGPSGTRDDDAAQKAAQAQAAQVQVNGFAAMMAQMGAMGQMGQMGSFPPPANWMATYHQFLSQMTTAAQTQNANPFAHLQGINGMSPGGMPGIPPMNGVTFPPMMMLNGKAQAFPGAPNSGLFRPTARAAPAASPNSGSGEEKAAMVTV